MSTMESGNMEENASTENGAKISDSGYSNTCSNSQSHTSSGSSASRNGNRLENSGYHRGNQSTLGSCTETLPKPISKHKEKGYKKKKSQKTLLQTQTDIVIGRDQHVHDAVVASQTSEVTETSLATVADLSAVTEIPPSCKPILDKSAEEVAVVELVDATDPGVHNDGSLTSDSKAGLTLKINPLDESSTQSSEEYYVIVSMHDGLVCHATPSLYACLGYPIDSWTRKLFIDFIDPRDKNFLNERIASEMANSQDTSPGANGRKSSIFCRLRKFNSNVDNGMQQQPQCQQQQPNGIQYVPFCVNMKIHNFHTDKSSACTKQAILIIATFQPVHSAYKVPEETIIPTVFTTRHNASCHLSYVDPDIVQYLGYLPQDMIGRSLFDFYHPEDLPLIKDIYQIVINLDNSSFRSKPYRFIVQNGSYVVLETEWSSFINPWTKSVEFVTGKHRVLKGPADPNVFNPPGNRKIDLLANISELELQQAKVIEKEIRELLVEGVQRKSTYPITGCNSLSKENDFNFFGRNSVKEIINSAITKDHMAVDNRSFSEHDSVMLGEISPHHEDLDSKSSSETLPSYNQLNYQDNIDRFFNSNINVTADNGPYGSDDENRRSTANSSNEHGRNNTSRPELKCTSSTNGSGNSGSGENLSSESNNLQSSFGSGGGTSNTTSNNSTNDNNATTTPIVLTKSLLNRHNEDMEKLMMQKHREQKKGDKRNKSSLADQMVKTDQPAVRCASRNHKKLKRDASQTWEGDKHHNKVPRHDDSTTVHQNANHTSNTLNANANRQEMANSNPNANPWSAMSMRPTTTVQNLAPINAFQALARYPIVPQMLPVYYMPVQQPRGNPMNQATSYCFVPVQYMATTMPSLMYPPIIGAPAPANTMYRPYIVPESVPAAPSMNVMPQVVCPPSTAPPTVIPTTTASTSNLNVHPASRETSIKAEPRSTTAMSESSKKIFSPSGVVSSCVSNEGGCFFNCSLNKSFDSSSMTNTNTDQRNTVSSFEPHYSSSSSMKENGINRSRKAASVVRKQPSWMESVKLTPEIVYRYQIEPKKLSDTLKADQDFLKNTKQPSLVTEQLGQLFLDLDLQGLGKRLMFDEVDSNNTNDSYSDESQSPMRMGAW